MITKEYYSEISEDTISEALVTDTRKEYPKRVAKEISISKFKTTIKKVVMITILSLFVILLGVNIFREDNIGERLLSGFLALIALLFLIVSIFQLRQKGNTLESLIRKFYTNLPKFSPSKPGINGDSFQSYQMLAPNVMERLSHDDFITIWEQVYKEIISAVKYQDFVTCENCTKTSKGLWLLERIIFKDKISEELKRFYECPSCKKVYCDSCLSNLPNKPECPNCGTSLLFTNQGIAPFLAEPLIQLNHRTYNLHIDQLDANMVDVDFEITYSFYYHRITESPTSYFGIPSEPSYLDLGEKGKVKVKLNNKAVKIGENWRLLSPAPYQDKLEAMISMKKSKPQDKRSSYCSKCGSPIKNSDRFCWKCGAKNE